MRTKAEEHFLNLILNDRVVIEEIKQEPYVKISIDNSVRAINKIASRKREDSTNYSYSIYHNGKMLTLNKLIYMHQNRKYVPEGYQVIHKNLDPYDFSFDNLKLMTHQEHQNFMVDMGVYAISEKTRQLRSKNAIMNNPQTKLSLSKVEYYRCQYHQQKMTVNAIMIDSGMSRKSVDNLLKFKSYSFDPITGEFDKELYLYYSSEDIKPYKRKIENPAPKKPKEIDFKEAIIVKKTTKSGKKKDMVVTSDQTKPKKEMDTPYFKYKVMSFPLTFSDCELLCQYRDVNKLTIEAIVKGTSISHSSVTRHIAMYKFFIRIFPNYTYIESNKLKDMFTKFADKYYLEFSKSSNPDIKPYSMKMFIRTIQGALKDIYTDYKSGVSLEELSAEYGTSINTIKLGIVEYDRYMRPEGAKGLTPEQFNHVYS